MDEAQKSVIEQSKLKTIVMLKKMDIPLSLLMVLAMGIIFFNYVFNGNIAFAVVFGIFTVLQVYSLGCKLITRKKPQDHQQDKGPMPTLQTPEYIN